MKTVSANELTKSYQELYPSEILTTRDFDQVEQIMTNWLDTYLVEPERKISVSSFHGKVTKSLFLALDLKIPKTKSEMLKVLS